MSFQPFQIIYQIKDQPIQIEQIRFRQEENLIQTKTINFNDELEQDDQFGVEEIFGIFRDRTINAWNSTNNIRSTEVDVQMMFETIVENPVIKSEPIEVSPTVDDDYIEAIEFFGNIKQEEELQIVEETVEQTHLFVCNECGQSFKRKVELVQHLNVHNEFQYKCEKCGQTFKMSFYFNRHVCNQCQKCRQRFKSKGALKNHQEIYCGSFECDKCGLQLMHKKDISIHFAENHLNMVGKIECDLCEVKCTSTEAMRNHMNFEHEEVVCQLCDIKTKKFQFKNHMKLVHAKEINLKCQLCKMEFDSERKFELHNRMHNKKFSCRICERKFAKLEFLQAHFKKRHDNLQIFSCPMCAKQFPAKNFLRTHLRSHTVLQAITKFTCKVCRYSTYYKENLDKHEAKHVRKEKVKDLKKNWIKCDKCPTKLKNKLKLSSHKWKYHKFE